MPELVLDDVAVGRVVAFELVGATGKMVAFADDLLLVTGRAVMLGPFVGTVVSDDTGMQL